MIYKTRSFISKQVASVKRKLIEESVVSLEECNNAFEMAIADVAFLLSYMYKYSEYIEIKKASLCQ